MPEVPRPLPLNELNLPSGSHIIVKTALAFVRIAWSVKINGEPAPGSRSRGGVVTHHAPSMMRHHIACSASRSHSTAFWLSGCAAIATSSSSAARTSRCATHSHHALLRPCAAPRAAGPQSVDALPGGNAMNGITVDALPPFMPGLPASPVPVHTAAAEEWDGFG